MCCSNIAFFNIPSHENVGIVGISTNILRHFFVFKCNFKRLHATELYWLKQAEKIALDKLRAKIQQFEKQKAIFEEAIEARRKKEAELAQVSV